MHKECPHKEEEKSWKKGELQMFPSAFVCGKKDADNAVFSAPLVKKVRKSSEQGNKYKSDKTKENNFLFMVIGDAKRKKYIP